MDAKHGKQTGDRPGSEPSGGTDTTEIRLPGAPERQRILDLGASVWAFSALASALEGRILNELATPQTPAQISERTGTSAALIEAVLDVLTALDLVRVTGDAFVCTPGMSVYTGGPDYTALGAGGGPDRRKLLRPGVGSGHVPASRRGD